MSKRIEQVNQLLQRTIGDLFLRELDLPRGTILTIKQVETAPDCKSAAVWVSVLPEAQREEVGTLLEKSVGHFQRLLNKKVVMEFTPKITFRIDTTESRADRVLRILDRIQSEKEMP